MSRPNFDDILIFTDGACSGNPGPGGWGSIIVVPEGDVIELGGGEDGTTNNRMELNAPIEALKAVKGRKEAVHIYTDSVYVIRGITEWIWAWRRRGWKNQGGEPVANQDMWLVLSALVAERKQAGLHWHYVKGHAGIPGNDRTDEIAVSFSKKRPLPLYVGPLLRYPVAIHDLPENDEVPKMPSAAQKKKPPAYSYLSSLGGVVMRHRSWESCERRVKGQSGAKFKKALSAEDEKTILKSWGFDPEKVQVQDI